MFQVIGEDFACNQSRFKPVAKISAYVNAKISAYVNLPENDYEAMTYHLTTQGPISISVDASSWFRYASGVFNGCNQTNPDINHAVQLVGLGNSNDGNGDYWIVRNSWASSWGEEGYIRLHRSPKVTCGLDITPWNGNACNGDNNTVVVCGTCGILYSGVYPII